MSRHLAQFDPEISTAIRRETERQEYSLEFIASENFVSERVLEAQGSVLTTNTPRATPANVTMAAASVSMSPSSWRSTGRSSCSAPSMPTCSRIPDPRPTWQSTFRSASRATRSSA